MIYLDHNATTPVLPEVRDAMWPFFTNEWGNPSSAYGFGARVKTALSDAQQSVALLVGADPSEVIFTSGATEANNTAIHSAVLSFPGKRHVITAETEHSSVLSYCRSLEQRGYDVTYLPVDSYGFPSMDSLGSAIRSDTALVSLMWANNETGVILPAARIAELCAQKNVLFHCDAVQAVGKLPINFSEVGCDALSLSGHKLGAPKGVGALIVKKATPFQPLILGGKQQEGRRGGTESVALIAGLGAACCRAGKKWKDWNNLTALRDGLETAILKSIDGAYRNGAEGQRLPNTLNFGIRGVDSDSIVTFLDRHDVCVSSGSACLENALSPSHVIMAMTGDYERSNEAVRVSLGLNTTQTELDRFLELLRSFLRATR